jgi:glycerol-3-phosphate dehydrogenase
MTKILLIGYGQWGKALLKLVTAAGNTNITIYTRQKNLEQSLTEIVGTNPSIDYTDLLDKALEGHDLCIIAKKSQEINGFLEELGERKLMACLQTSKGLSADGQFFSDLLPHYCHGPLGVLYGPNFASEILAGNHLLQPLVLRNHNFFYLF